MHKLKAIENIGANVSRMRNLDFDNHALSFLKGTFEAFHYRKGKLLNVIKGKNAPTTVGKNFLLDCVYGAATPVVPINPWYIGLINNSPTPTLLTGDTLSSHSGWSESTAYSGNRKEWLDADSASATKASSSVSTFSMNATVSIYGIFICGLETGSSGAAVDAVQTITPTGTISGGTFTLTIDGVTSGSLNYNDNAATIQTAIAAMSNSGTGDVTVSGGGLNSAPVVLTFTDGKGKRPQPLVSITSSLTGGGTVAVAHTTYGRGASNGILWSEGAFSSVIDLTSGDDLKVTYSLGF